MILSVQNERIFNTLGYTVIFGNISYARLSDKEIIHWYMYKVSIVRPVHGLNHFNHLTLGPKVL